jgi:enterochelin esterase family protein
MTRNMLGDFTPFQTALLIAVLVAALVPTATFGQRTALVSPDLHKDGSMTFRLERPGAHEVLVALAGLQTPLKMTQAEGVWSATSAPLELGTYWYSYLVDGKAELDPLNADVIPNYAYLNSVVRVTGPSSQPWERTDVPHGEVHRHFYESKIVLGVLGGRSEYFVYTPPGYDARASTSYPTLYLLHGLSQGAADWTAMGGANFVLDNLIAQGKAKPMVVVMPLGYGDMAVAAKQPSADPEFGRLFVANDTLFGNVLLKEIVPRVEAEYRVIKTREGKAIAGASMGGAQSLGIGLNGTGKDATGEFAWLAGFSAAAPFVRPPSVGSKASKLRLLWISCGTSDPLLEPNRKLIKELQERGYAVKAVETSGAHIWPVWQRNLVDFVQLLF